MLIAISGSQGCGKSSLLNELQNRGYNVLQYKTARSVLTNWNMTLEQIYQNSDSIQEFQSQLLARKLADEAQYANSEQIYFTERSYIDLLTYTISHLGNKNRYSDWINAYFSLCIIYQKLYSSVMYIEGGLFDVHHDGIRPSNNHYCQMIDLHMKYNTQKHTARNFSIIDMDGVNLRADFVQTQLTKIIGE